MERRGAWIRLACAVERLSEAAGAVARWLALAIVLLGVFNALARYGSRWLGQGLSSNAWLELQWYLFSAVFLLGASHTLRHDGHVRVDVWYSRLGPRAQAWVGALGTVLLLLPFCAVVVAMAWPIAMDSWAVREGSPDPGGLPRYPIKLLVPIAFGLLFLQGVAGLVRHLRILRQREPPTVEDDGRVGL